MVAMYLALACALALHLYVLHSFYHIMLAVWFPDKAKERWTHFIQSPIGELLYPLLKWLSPIAVVTLPLGLVAALLELAVGFVGNAQ